MTVLTVIFLLRNMGWNNIIEKSKLRCKSRLSLNNDPPAFQSSQINVHWGSFNRRLSDNHYILRTAFTILYLVADCQLYEGTLVWLKEVSPDISFGP